MIGSLVTCVSVVILLAGTRWESNRTSSSSLHIGVAIVILKGGSYVALPIVGSLVVVSATTLFAIVFRTSQA